MDACQWFHYVPTTTQLVLMLPCLCRTDLLSRPHTIHVFSTYWQGWLATESHSHSLKIPWGGGPGGGVNHSSQDFPHIYIYIYIYICIYIKTPTHTVTEMRGHCSEGGKGWGRSSSLFSKKKTLILERLEHLKKSWFFDANCLFDLLAIPKKKIAQRSFEFPIPLPIPSKFAEKRMNHSLIPIPSGFKGMTIAFFFSLASCVAWFGGFQKKICQCR